MSRSVLNISPIPLWLARPITQPESPLKQQCVLNMDNFHQWYWRLRDGRQILNDICCLQSNFDLRPDLEYSYVSGRKQWARKEGNKRIEEYLYKCSHNYCKDFLLLSSLDINSCSSDKPFHLQKFVYNCSKCLLRFESFGHTVDDVNKIH